MKKPKFKPGVPEHVQKALRKALKAAHSPEANAKRIQTMRATAARKKQEKLNGTNGAPKNGALVPLDMIPGEKPPVISYSDTPGSTTTGSNRSKDERLQLAKALVATVFKLVS